jgi:predicted Zn-dependent protease
MELRVQDQQNALTPERARASVDYWRDTARELQTSSEDQNLQNPRMAYAKMASEQAALLLDRNYTQEAEETLRVAVQIAPSSPEALFRYIDVLTRQSRAAEGIPMVEAAIKAAPENPQFQSLLAQLKTGKK